MTEDIAWPGSCEPCGPFFEDHEGHIICLGCDIIVDGPIVDETQELLGALNDAL